MARSLFLTVWLSGLAGMVFYLTRYSQLDGVDWLVRHEPRKSVTAIQLAFICFVVVAVMLAGLGLIADGSSTQGDWIRQVAAGMSWFWIGFGAWHDLVDYGRSAIPLAILRVLLATVVTAAWFFWPNVVTLNLAAVLIATYLISYFYFDLRILTALSVVLVIYDVYAVFWGPMNEVAMAMQQTPSLFVDPSGKGVLGMGDVVFPGMLIVFAIRLGAATDNPGLWYWPLAGYVLGMAAGSFSAVLTARPQPGLLYLVPATYAGLWWAMRRCGVGSKRWDYLYPVPRDPALS